MNVAEVVIVLINDPYARLCVPDVTKNINIKVFNMMSKINEAKQILWHETCKCVCRLTTAVCNTKQIWNENKCKCECKEDVITKMTCDKGYMWNPSTCECECDKLCDIGHYLDYKNCVFKKSIVDRLVEECVNIVDEDIMYYKTLSIDPNDCPSRTPYVALFIVFLLINVAISGSFIYYRWYKKSNFKNDVNKVNYSEVGTIY